MNMQDDHKVSAPWADGPSANTRSPGTLVKVTGTLYQDSHCILLTVHAVFVEFVDFVSIRIVQMRVYVCMTRLHAGL